MLVHLMPGVWVQRWHPAAGQEAVNCRYNQAQACHRQVLALKADTYDPIISLAKLELERRKVAMALGIASPT